MGLKKEDRILVCGHNGMVGSAIVRNLHSKKYNNLLLPSRSELDLLDKDTVADYFNQQQPACVILAAAKVGGIQANIATPVEFLLENLTIQNNVISQAFQSKVRQFLFLGSSCIYPRNCKQPIKEEYLLTGALEPTNEGYALAKIAGLKLLEYYRKQYGFKSISLLPCNVYGTNDSFDPDHAHVLSSLVKKICDAKENNHLHIEIWGTGIARREFMHADDMARGVSFYLENYDDLSLVNIGWGRDISILELVQLIRSEVGYTGDIIWDTSKPDGMLRKCLDVSRMKATGFTPQISLKEGIRQSILEYTTINKTA
jgi:GDP-L-fucose synthase